MATVHANRLAGPPALFSLWVLLSRPVFLERAELRCRHGEAIAGARTPSPIDTRVPRRASETLRLRNRRAGFQDPSGNLHQLRPGMQACPQGVGPDFLRLATARDRDRLDRTD